MANGAWFNEFPASETEFLEIGESDHKHLVTFMSHEKKKSQK